MWGNIKKEYVLKSQSKMGDMIYKEYKNNMI